MTDAYARDDQILTITGYDNSDFTEWLNKQEFTISKSSWSNYPLTFLSLSSSLGMDYLYKDGDKIINRRAAYSIIRGENPVVKHLKQNGYYYFHAPSRVWDGSRCGGSEDACFNDLASIIGSEVIINILRMTPLINIIQKYNKRDAYLASTFYSTLEHLDTVKHNTPYFLFFHSYPPHEPYIFHPDCSLKTSNSVEQRKDTRTPQEIDRDAIEGYISNLKCVNKQLRHTITRIRKDDPSAIIIVHGDHGTDFTLNWEQGPLDWTGEQLAERFGIQIAMHLPKECRHLSYEGISPVNIFEVVFACLEGRGPNIKPDTRYGVLYERPGLEEQLVYKISTRPLSKR